MYFLCELLTSLRREKEECYKTLLFSELNRVRDKQVKKHADYNINHFLRRERGSTKCSNDTSLKGNAGTSRQTQTLGSLQLEPMLHLLHLISQLFNYYNRL